MDSSVLDILDAPIEKLRPSGDATEPERGIEGDAAGAPAPSRDAESAPPGAIGIEGCPGPEAYVGDSAWRAMLEIPRPGPQLCASWVETGGSLDPASTDNSLMESLEKKARVSIAPGTYRLPDMPGTAQFGLPICFWRADRRAEATGTGTIVRSVFNGSPAFQLSLPVVGGTITAAFLSQGSPVSVDGMDSLRYCSGGCPGTPATNAYLAPCETTGAIQWDTVTLEKGTVDLTVVFYPRSGIGAGTEPAIFTRASGSYRGVAFDQRDYFKLVYSPQHHHFVRHYAVLFDAPIDGACGLELINLPGPPGARLSRAWAVDCELGRMAEIPVTGTSSRAEGG